MPKQRRSEKAHVEVGHIVDSLVQRRFTATSVESLVQHRFTATSVESLVQHRFTATSTPALHMKLEPKLGKSMMD